MEQSRSLDRGPKASPRRDSALTGAIPRVEQLLENISDEFAAIDHEWRYLYVNDAALRAIQAGLGRALTRDDVIGRNIWELFPAHVGSVFYDKYHTAVREQKSVQFEAHSHVTRRWIRVNAYPTPDGLCVLYHDISQQRQAEENAAYHAYLLDNVYDAVIAIDERLMITGWNRGAREMYGWSAEEVLGRHLWDAVPTALTEAERANAFKQLEETGRCQVHSMTYGKNGVAVYVEGIIIALREQRGGGPITGYVSIRRNVTDQRQAEDQLRRSEAHLAEAQRLGHVGSWMWNVATGRLEWSQEQFRIFGVDPETFTPTGESTARFIHPDDLPHMKRILEDAAHERRDFEVNYRIIRPDGSRRYLRGIGHPVIAPSGDLDFVGVCVDVTERMEVEQQLRRSEAYLVEGQRISHTGTWAWNAATGELFWTLEHFRIFGVDPATFHLTIYAACRCIHPDDRAAAIEAFETATRDGKSFEREFRVVRSDGTIAHVHSVGHPVLDNEGKPTEWVGTTMDVTTRKEEEASRNELRRRLLVAQEDERRRISREMHDELGQQLSSLTLRLAALKREYGQHSGLADQLSSLETAVGALDADLDFLIWQLRPTALDDLGLVGAFKDHIAHWSAHSGIAAESHVGGMERTRLTAEIETTIYRLLQEALNNVAKHARARRVSIVLAASPDHVSLIVEDDGIGFEASAAFGPSQSGLGLIGMRERAALLGGTVDIESHPGNGTTFVARIPTVLAP